MSKAAKMKPIIILSTFIFSFLSTISKAQNNVADEKPALVVGIVIDQMRFDYLYRYYKKYGEKGFKRMLTNGLVCKNTHYNYVPTATGPGHASIYTGTTPSYHGIVGNEWYERGLQKEVYCVEDEKVQTVGSKNNNGRFSPKRLRTTTITDELRINSNWQSKVISISIKNRGAVLPGGFTANSAYWYDEATGNMISSTHYMQELPKWVSKFNDKKLPDHYLNQTWTTLLPVSEYTESYKDDNHYEAVLPGKEKPVFPYNLKEMRKETADNGYELLRATPFGNSLLTELAIGTLKNEDLGKDQHTDFLAISYSSTDIIGHAFGPHSVEIEDTYLRLDQELEKLFETLDNQIGKDNYLVFLTADHAAVNVPQYLKDHKVEAGYFAKKSFEDSLEHFLNKKYGSGKWVLNLDNSHIYLNKMLIREQGLVLANVQQKVADFCLTLDGIEQVYTASDLLQNNYQDGIASLLQNGFSQKRSGDVILVLRPHWLPVKEVSEYSKRGTSHGSAYAYDTHVPLIWYGWKIPTKILHRPISITDIAPTISQLLNLQMPASFTGTPIQELFHK